MRVSFDVEKDEVLVVCEGYNGEQEYCVFPISYLYFSKEDLIEAEDQKTKYPILTEYIYIKSDT